MTFADLTALKETLFLNRYSSYNNYTRKTNAEIAELAVVVEDLPSEQCLADDECYAQMKMFVAEIQSCAEKFRRRRNATRLEDLLSATDSFSAFIMDILGSSDTGGNGEPGVGGPTAVSSPAVAGNTEGAEGSGAV